MRIDNVKTGYFCTVAVIIVTAACVIVPVFAQVTGGTVSVPAGVFSRGSEEAGAEPDESPVRPVRMSGFGMMATEVTEAQYGRCVDAGQCVPAHYDDGKCLIWSGGGFMKVVVPSHLRGDEFPVVCVTWQEARAFCASRGMRLPTEAQWEYAALGGGRGRYAWGDAAPEGSRCSRGAPKAVGGFAPNGYGLYDMTGNVWEWTADFYAADSYENSADTDPKGPDAGYYRVIRGGGWYSGPNELRVRNRHWFAAGGAEASVGFRCVK
jgi:formylglycine-generating enzyme required for sulfatase activity